MHIFCWINVLGKCVKCDNYEKYFVFWIILSCDLKFVQWFVINNSTNFEGIKFECVITFICPDQLIVERVLYERNQRCTITTLSSLILVLYIKEYQYEIIFAVLETDITMLIGLLYITTYSNILNEHPQDYVASAIDMFIAMENHKSWMVLLHWVLPYLHVCVFVCIFYPSDDLLWLRICNTNFLASLVPFGHFLI